MGCIRILKNTYKRTTYQWDQLFFTQYNETCQNQQGLVSLLIQFITERNGLPNSLRGEKRKKGEKISWKKESLYVVCFALGCLKIGSKHKKRCFLCEIWHKHLCNFCCFFQACSCFRMQIASQELQTHLPVPSGKLSSRRNAAPKSVKQLHIVTSDSGSIFSIVIQFTMLSSPVTFYHQGKIFSFVTADNSLKDEASYSLTVEYARKGIETVVGTL